MSKNEVAAVLDKLNTSGRITPADKHWITVKLKDQNRHDLVLEVIKACGTNPQLPYIFMLLGGATVATVSSVIDGLDVSTAPEKKSDMFADIGATLGDLALGSLKITGIGGLMTAEMIEKQFGGGGKTWQDIACGSVTAAGTSIAVFAGGMLVLMAVFGNGGGSGGAAGLLGAIA